MTIKIKWFSENMHNIVLTASFLIQIPESLSIEILNDQVVFWFFFANYHRSICNYNQRILFLINFIRWKCTKNNHKCYIYVILYLSMYFYVMASSKITIALINWYFDIKTCSVSEEILYSSSTLNLLSSKVNTQVLNFPSTHFNSTIVLISQYKENIKEDELTVIPTREQKLYYNYFILEQGKL